MDDNTRDVLVTAIQVGGGAIGALFVALVGFWSGRALERQRWQRDEAKRRYQLQLTALGQFIAALDALVAEAVISGGSPEHIRAQTHLNAKLAEVRLVTPISVEPGRVYDLACEMANLIEERVTPEARDAAKDNYLEELARFQVRAASVLRSEAPTDWLESRDSAKP